MKKTKKKSPIDPSKWQWFGSHGHLCVGRWCRFHMTTKVGDYLVSTVGEYVPPCGSEKAEAAWLKENPQGEEIGYDRKYETMVFEAGAPCSAKGCSCGLPSTDGSELDMLGYNTAKDAREGHMALCRKWAA